MSDQEMRELLQKERELYAEAMRTNPGFRARQEASIATEQAMINRITRIPETNGYSNAVWVPDPSGDGRGMLLPSGAEKFLIYKTDCKPYFTNSSKDHEGMKK
jgi:hypothetical protein